MTADAVPSVNDIKYKAWSNLKTWIYGRLTSEGDKKNPTPCRVRLMSAISCLQIILGFACIILALVAVAAAFSVREDACHYNTWRREEATYTYFDNLVKNLTQQANADRIALRVYYEKKIREMKNGVTTEESNEYPEAPEFYYGRNSWQDYRFEIPYYQDDYLQNRHLIIDYLGVPGWTGILLLVTGLVGCRARSAWKDGEYHSISSFYTMLNVLCVFIFAPLMLAANILQIVLSQWENDFRWIVSQISCAFAGVVMALCIFASLFGCCCPMTNNKYKKLETEEVHNEKTDKTVEA